MDTSSSTPSSPPPATRRRRWPYYVLGAVVLLIVLPLAVVAWRLDAWANELKDRALPDIEKRLGRKVTVGRLDISLLGLAATARDISIGPDPTIPGEKGPLLAIARVAADVGASSLFSFGKRVRVEAVEVDGLTVDVVRYADGTTNVERLQARLAEEPTKESPPPDADTRARVRHARLDKLRVNDARFGFTDLARNGARVAISELDVAADDVGLARAWTLAVTAAVLQPTKNLDVRAQILPAPEQSDGFGAPGLAGLTVKMTRTEIAPLFPFLAPDSPLATAESAALQTDLKVERAATGSGMTAARGSVTLSNLRFPGGAPFDAGVDVDARADTDRGDVDVAKLVVKLGTMAVEARGKLMALKTAPRFEGFRLASRGLDFDTLRRHYPAMDESGVKLGGPFTLEASASGDGGQQQFQGRLDLSSASIEVPDLFRKPAGALLALRTRGTAAADAVTLEELLLEIVDWRLGVKGSVKGLSGAAPAVDLVATTAAPALDGLLRLLPPVARAVPSGRPLAGALAVNGTVKGTAQDLAAAVTAKLSDLNVKVPDAWLRGGGVLDARVTKRGEAMDVNVTLDLDGLEALYADVLRKTAGTPLTVKLQSLLRGRTTTTTFDARIAAMRANGRAQLEQRGAAQAFDVTVEAPPFSLPTLFALAPTMKPDRIGQLHVGGKVRARGTSGKPESIAVDVPSFTAAAGKSDLTGKLSFSNPDRPVVQLDASSKYLDLDDFLPPTGKDAPPKTKEEAKAKRAPGEEDPLTRVTGQARLAVARGRAQNIDYQDLKADLKLAGGRAVARTLEVGVFGGRFSGTGTELSLTDENSPFTFKGKLTNIDIDAALTQVADMPDLLKGRLSADIGVAAAGTEAEVLKKTLDGLLSGEIAGAAFVPGRLLGDLRGPLAKAVDIPGLAKLLGEGVDAKLDPRTERALGDLATAARFQGGTITLQRPLAATTPHGPLSLDGNISLEGVFDLSGTWTLTPAAASLLTGGRVPIDQPLPIALKVTGPVRAPKIVPTNAGAIAKTLALAYARSGAGKALQDQAGKAASAAATRLGVQDKVGAVDAAKAAEAKAQAEAAARAQADQARAQAEAQRAKAEEEARQRAAEAKEKAKAGAKEKLKGLLGR